MKFKLLWSFFNHNAQNLIHIIKENLSISDLLEYLHFVCLCIIKPSKQNIYPMDLRSAHKLPDKPSPRIRLSLTRSTGTEIDQNGRRYREGVGYRRVEIRKNRQCRSKLMDDFKLSQQPTRHPLPAKDSAEKEWNRDEEDEKKRVKKMRKDEENTTEVHQDIPSGRCCVASIQQLLLRYSACNIFRGHEGHSEKYCQNFWITVTTS